MTDKITQTVIIQVLEHAADAHHEFEKNYLQGKPDVHWAGWYAAYTLGKLGNFTKPSLLTRWLERVPTQGSWNKQAAQMILTEIEKL